MRIFNDDGTYNSEAIRDDLYPEKFPGDNRYPHIKLRVDFPKAIDAIMQNKLIMLEIDGYSAKDADEKMKYEFGKVYEEAKE